MKVRYIYSACVVIETPDCSILCDPWFTQGTYDGSWFQWPVVQAPLETIGPVEFIYISHIHPDHYDPVFLRQYLRTFPEARIVIGPQSPPFLENKLRADGFPFKIITEHTVGRTRMAILPNHARPVNIDTALVVVRDGRSVANLNDNPFDPDQVEGIRQRAGGPVTLALLSYGGAMAHPQTYLFDTRRELDQAIRIKERHFLDIFHRFIAELEPHAVIPFAGKYWLGGPLAALNGDRGIPDAIDAAAETNGRAVVLADGGDAFFDLVSMTASKVRTHPYDKAEVERYLNAMDFSGYAYEREIRPDDERALPLASLLETAVQRARRRFTVNETCWVCICPDKFGTYLCFDPAGQEGVAVKAQRDDLSSLTPRVEIYIDDRYLFGLLTRLYHWNNASLGSHYRFRRVPDIFRRDVFSFLDVLHV